MRPLEINPENLALTLIAGRSVLRRVDREYHRDAIEQATKIIEDICKTNWDDDAILWIIEKP